MQSTLPYERASLLSKWTYSWINYVFKIKGGIKYESLYGCPDWMQSSRLRRQFLTLWKLNNDKKLSWIFMVVRLGGSWFAWSGLLLLVADIQQLFFPIIMRKLTALLNNSSESKSVYLLGFSFVFCYFGKKIFQNQSIFITHSISYLVRAGTMTALYGNLLRVKNFWSIGGGLNRVVVDSNRTSDLLLFFHTIWRHPLKLVIAFYTAIFLMHKAAMFGIVFIFFVMCSLLLLAKSVVITRKKIAKLSDERLQITSDVLKAVKTIKSLNLQESFIKKIHAARMKELGLIKYLNAQYAFAVSIQVWSPVMASSIMFIAAIWLRCDFESAAAFFAVRSFKSMTTQLWTLYSLANRFTSFSVSTARIDQLKRIEVIADFDDDQDALGDHHEQNNESDNVNLLLDNVSFKIDDNRYFFHNLNLHIDKPGIYGITGVSGSGKSLLLAICAGVVAIEESGLIAAPKLNSTGYCSYPGWIQRGTVAENIIFGRSIDVEKLSKCMVDCLLDGEVLLEQQVGEAGCLLSGSQRQRVALARALYDSPRLLLVDNIWNLFDSEAATKIWNSCIVKNSQVIRIIVTGKPSLLAACDKVFSLDTNGCLSELSTINDVKNCQDHDICEQDFSKFHKKLTTLDQQVNDEQTSQTHTYVLLKKFAKLCGGYRVVFLLSITILNTHLLKFYRDKELKDFLKSTKIVDSLRLKQFAVNLMKWTLGHGVFTVISNFLSMIISYRLSMCIHDTTLDRFVNSKMVFLEKNDSGKLLNRLGKDLETIDYNVATRMVSLIGGISSILTSLYAIANFSASFVCTLLMVMCMVFFLQRKSMSLYRPLLRVSGVSLTPIYSQLSESSLGHATIRAFRQVPKFSSNFAELVNQYTMASFLSSSVRRWMVFRSDCIATLYLTLVVLFCIFCNVPKEEAGLLLSYALQGAESIESLMTFCSEFDQILISIERLSIFSESLVQEKSINPLDASNVEPKHHTAMTDKLIFKGISIEYLPGKPLIDNFTAVIQANEKILVIGKTGVGKSSFLSALLGFVDYTGEIILDGLKLSEYPLQKRQQRFSVILQDSGCLPSSIRMNVDPYELYGDSEIWKVLDEVGIGYFIRQMPLQLENSLDSFSAGQKQLLSFCRVILHNSEVVILDEPSSSIDFDEEVRLHQLILARNSIVICVSHSMNLVEFYDRVFMIDSGRIKESKQLIRNIV